MISSEENHNRLEKEAWNQFCLIVKNFFGNCNLSSYASFIQDFFIKVQTSWGKNVTENSLSSFHLDFFPPNMGEISDELGKRFHREIEGLENRYQGRITRNMLADYCWFLQRESATVFKG